MSFEKIDQAFRETLYDLQTTDDVMKLASDLLGQVTFLGTIVAADTEQYYQFRKEIADYLMDSQFDDYLKLQKEAAKTETLN